MQRFEYILSALPALEAIGSVPPMTKQELLERIAGSEGLTRTVEVLLLSDDLKQYEALLAEEIGPDDTDMAVLTMSQSEGICILPDALMVEEHDCQESSRAVTDHLWERYFRMAEDVAKKANSAFLLGWVGYEVGLRNALASARAHVLELDPLSYQVASELGDRSLDFSGTLSAWSAAADPLAALEVLDKARWEWLEGNDQWYSFKADEILAYTARLLLLHRWRRVQSEATIRL